MSPSRMLAVMLLVSMTGCRSCDESRTSGPVDAGQPPMPTGMLLPTEAGPAAVSKDGGEPRAVEKLLLTRGEKGGAFTELQVAPAGELPDRWVFDHWRADSRFLSLDAMTLLNMPFARALPGFDLFLPKLFPPAALEKLVVELAAFEKEWTALATLAQAKARWAKYSELVAKLQNDGEWLEARDTLVATIHELSAMAKAHAAKKESLWVLGP